MKSVILIYLNWIHLGPITIENMFQNVYVAKLSPSPSSNWAVAGSIPSFSVNDETLELFLDLNPIGHWGHLTLFQPPSHLGEYFQCLG